MTYKAIYAAAFFADVMHHLFKEPEGMMHYLPCRLIGSSNASLIQKKIEMMHYRPHQTIHALLTGTHKILTYQKKIFSVFYKYP